jgi:hypothetical protein
MTCDRHPVRVCWSISGACGALAAIAKKSKFMAAPDSRVPSAVSLCTKPKSLSAPPFFVRTARNSFQRKVERDRRARYVLL